MKQYLMMGAAGMALCVLGTSCTREKDLYDPILAKQMIVDNYNQAFIETFGEPADDQTWGFGDAAASRTTRGHNANANEWADIDNSTGFGGWLVPDALTEGQKLRVKAYFQANPNLTFEDPHWTNFFVQQVYKGGTDVGPNSTEVVTAANGDKYTSENMNLLTVGQKEEHINNFNRGTATSVNVLDNGLRILDHNETYHNDQIMLMVDIDDTSCFGYHDTGSSNEENPVINHDGAVNHNDRAALVSAAEIDRWAAANDNIGEAVVDKWDRSFIGFDLAIKEGDQIFSGNVQGYSDGLFQGFAYFYYGEDNIVGVYEYEDSTHADNNWNWVLKDKFKNTGLKDAKGNEIKLLRANTSFYSGKLVELEESDLKINKFKKDELGEGNTDMLNMVKVSEMVANGYYPVEGSAFKTWVKPTLSYDNYYSDWIVTVTKAKRVGEVTPATPELRVIAEDLSATEASDFDFNDVVFDVKYVSDTLVSITLQAAGGTLPLRINGDDNWEVHKLFDVPTTTMVNTGAEKLGLSGENRPAVTKYLTGNFSSNENEFRQQVKAIKIEVEKEDANGDLRWFVLTAEQGEPACKIGVPTGFNWLSERQSMVGKEGFSEWVKNPTTTIVWY